MAKDEKVDGAQIASRILNAMPAGHKEKLVQAIKAADPQIARKIEDNLLSFDDIAELTPKSIQALLRVVEHRDLIVGLKTASDPVKENLFRNMSLGKRRLVEEDFAALPMLPQSEVSQAQARILKKLEELRTLGAAQSQTTRDVYV